MRLIFQKGKQRKLIEKYKAMHKPKTWADISKDLCVTASALNEWRHETVSLPLKIYSRMDKPGHYKQYITAKRKDSWGRIAGGNNSRGRRKKIKVPNNSPLLAEFFGIILGDGNVYVNKKYGVYQIRVASHPLQEVEYAQFVMGLFDVLFGLKTSITKRGRAIYVCADSRELADFLLKNLPGLKSKFSFPQWIYNDDICLRSFVRGLIDTDGSIYRLSNKNPKTMRIGFKNADSSLSLAYRKALLKLGLHPSKIIYRNIFLTRKADVKRYLKEIGFHNTKHRERLLKLAPSYSGQILPDLMGGD